KPRRARQRQARSKAIVLRGPILGLFTYSRRTPSYSDIWGPPLDSQNTVTATPRFTSRIAICSAKVSKPPYIAGMPRVPRIATLTCLSPIREVLSKYFSGFGNRRLDQAPLPSLYMEPKCRDHSLRSMPGRIRTEVRYRCRFLPSCAQHPESLIVECLQ